MKQEAPIKPHSTTLTVAAMVISAVVPSCTFASGRRQESPTMHRTVPTGPGTSASYWCDLIPKQEFRIITGLGEDLEEVRSSWLSDQGLCFVQQDRKYGPMTLTWEQREATKIVTHMNNEYANFRPTEIPKRLGVGFVVKTIDDVTNQPYYAIAAFRCGTKIPWLRLALSQMQPGRDYTSDLIFLIQICELRFKKLHNCTG